MRQLSPGAHQLATYEHASGVYDRHGYAHGREELSSYQRHINQNRLNSLPKASYKASSLVNSINHPPAIIGSKLRSLHSNVSQNRLKPIRAIYGDVEPRERRYQPAVGPYSKHASAVKMAPPSVASHMESVRVPAPVIQTHERRGQQGNKPGWWG